MISAEYPLQVHEFQALQQVQVHHQEKEEEHRLALEEELQEWEGVQHRALEEELHQEYQEQELL